LGIWRWRRKLGGRLIALKLGQLCEALEEYYGLLNERKMGMNMKGRSIEKPEALIKLEMCEKMKLPLVAGGLMDQPHIWLLEVGQVMETRMIFTNIPDPPTGVKM